MFAEKARYYVETLNWPVFPVNKQKRPLIERGCHSASRDMGQIEKWAERFPDANLAVATGTPSMVVVIDIDGERGEQSWRTVKSVVWFGKEPACPQVLTSKGRHLYFAGHGIANRVSSVLGRGIDVRGDGGSATLPPSIHESGTVYSWTVQPHIVRPPRFPPALSRLLRGEEAWPSPYKKPWRMEPRHDDLPPDLERLVDLVLKAGEGERNHTLNTAAFLSAKTIMAGKATEAEVMHQLSQAALSIGLDRTEIEATIRSGIRSGERKL